MESGTKIRVCWVTRTTGIFFYYYFLNLALAQVNQLFALMEDNFPLFHFGKCIQDRIKVYEISGIFSLNSAVPALVTSLLPCLNVNMTE